MKTIKLEINDSIFDKVMFFLTNLPKKDIRLNIESKQEIKESNQLRSISLKTKGFKFNRDEANAR